MDERDGERPRGIESKQGWEMLGNCGVQSKWEGGRESKILSGKGDLSRFEFPGIRENIYVCI